MKIKKSMSALREEFNQSCDALWEADSSLMAESPSPLVQAGYQVIKIRQQLADAEYMAALNAEKAIVLQKALADAKANRLAEYDKQRRQA